MDDLTRREVILTAAAAPLLPTAVGRALAADAASGAAVGPLLGHVDHQTAAIWYRPAAPGSYTATLTHAKSGVARSADATASPDHDLCITFTFDGLEADTDYRYTISQLGQTVVDGDDFVLRTAPAVGDPARTTLVMGSCASSDKFFDIWDRMAEQKPDALMLLGDTPYINSVALKVNRDRHRQFLSIPTLAALGASTPIWATWDDHDFGGNDTDGKIKNKHLIRQAFCEYRAHAEFGDGEHGVYTKFRRGPVEVFMIDARYFSQTEPSPVDPDKPTCLGKTQWAWLKKGLLASTAPFKLLATGMIWDDKKNSEKDDWETYRYEREALFDFIGEHKITGCVLIGGDIHVSRHLKHPMTDRIGYDLHQWVISPMHDSVIPELNVPHPHLKWGEPIANIFLRVVADTTVNPPTLEAVFMDRHGKRHYEVKLTAVDLTTARPARP